MTRIGELNRSVSNTHRPMPKTRGVTRQEVVVTVQQTQEIV
ncbi:hypothetical protein [Bacillus sp. S2-R3J1-FB-BA1]|nr:hypothetical protein [Bacillus sp. S2-R3J1-FB-BA1]